MDSKDATTNSSIVSGSSSLNNSTGSFSFDTELKNGFGYVNDTKKIDEGSGDIDIFYYNNDGNSVSGRLSNGSEDLGFVSGGEEFEMASDKPVLGKGNEGVEKDSGGFFLDSSEFPELSKTVPVSGSHVVVDDTKNRSRGGVLTGGSIVVDDVEKGSKDLGFKGEAEASVGGGGVELGSDLGGSVVDASAEKPEPEEKKEAGIKAAEITSVEPSSILEEKEVEDVKLNEEIGNSPVTQSEIIESSAGVKVNVADEVDDKVVEANGVKLTSEGDSVVDDIKVETPVPGVVVVEHLEENEGSNGTAALETGPEENSHSAEPTVSDLVDGSGVKLNTEVDSVEENIDVDKPATGVATVGKADDEGDDNAKLATEVDSLVENIDDNVNMLAPEVAIVGKADDEGDDNVKLATEVDSVVENIDVDVNMLAPGVAIVGKADDEGDDNVKLATEVDSVVETIDVDMSVPGVAIVGKKDDGGNNNVSNNSISGSDQTTQIMDETADKEVIGASDGSIGTRNFDSVEIETTQDDVVKDEPSDGEDDATTNGKETIAEDTVEFAAAEKSETSEMVTEENTTAAEAEKGVEFKEKVTGADIMSNGEVVDSEGDRVQAVDSIAKDLPIVEPSNETNSVVSDDVSSGDKNEHLENGLSGTYVVEESAETEENDDSNEEDSDGETDDMIFVNSEDAKKFMEALERGSGGDSLSDGESSQERTQRIDGQIVTDSDEEVDTDEGGETEMFDLAALIKAATGGGPGGENVTITSQDGSRLFSVERPAGLGSSLQSLRPAARPARSSIFSPSAISNRGESDGDLSEEEKKKLEKLQALRVKFLRLVHRLGLSSDESVAAQVLYRLALIAGRQTGELFNLDAAKKKALELEAEGKEGLDFSVSIMVVGKSGVGKSATINSIFGEQKANIDAFESGTTRVREITGMVDGVNVRVIDTPGLKSSSLEQSFNRSVLSNAKKLTKKNPADIVLYVDRLDARTRDLNDLPVLRTVTATLGPSIWRSAIVTLTHAASAPPEGPSGSPLSYEVFVTQRSHVVQQSIGQAVGDMRMMSPSLMNPVSLVENHPSCRKNRDGQKVLPNGQSWRPQLLMLCYSMKILSEANSLSKPQDPFDPRKLFGLRTRSPPLPYMLSSMLQSRAHPKLRSDQGADNDSDIDLDDLDDSDLEEDPEEYDQLPPFKPLKKSQLAKLSKEQKEAYFEEYDYRVKLLQKKQWKEELKRMREMKKKGKNYVNPDDYVGEEDDGAPAPVAVPLPDMVLPPSFDSDNPAYRFRFLEPTSQFLARPVLDTHGWDHDVGYDGVNLEQNLAIANRFPAVISSQITKDKKDFSFTMDSSISAKHGEKGSTMAGFDIQPIGKQLAYIVRGETKFKNLKKNKTAAGMSVTFLGENIVTGFKVEDQIAFGKQYSLVGSAGTVRYQSDSAYGANIEVQRRELDYPIGQVQSTFGLSIIKWRGDLALGFNSLAQFSAGRNSKVAVRAGINNKMTGQITVRTSSSEHLSLALAAVIPAVLSIYRKLVPDGGDNYSAY